MAQQANSFNFDQYNTLMKNAPVGLKLHLGVQLIKDVVSSLEYFDNPLEIELRPVYVDLKDFHRKYKEAAKAVAERNEVKADGGRVQVDLGELNKMQAQILALTEALAAKQAA